MTTPYITRDYFNTFFTEPQITRLLSYGYDSTTVSQSLRDAKIDQLITASSDQVDSFLVNYDLPLPFTPPALAQATAYIVAKNLFAVSQQPLPESWQREIESQYGYLTDLKNQTLNLPGIAQNTISGIGGNVTSTDGSISLYGTSGIAPQRSFSSRENWGKTW